MEADAQKNLSILAECFGVETSFQDATGEIQRLKPEVLFAILSALGAKMHSEADATQALRDRQLQISRRVLEPVVVSWEGAPVEVKLRLPEIWSGRSLSAILSLESGEIFRLIIDLKELPNLASEKPEALSFVRKIWRIPVAIPQGYHRLEIELPDQIWKCLVLRAPQQAFAPLDTAHPRKWGVFLPLYALRSQQGWGSGDFGTLEELLLWTKKCGGRAVATLPFLSSFLQEPCDPSPYSPVSRLFWNEFYLDILKIPELAQCPEAQNIIYSSGFQQELAAARRANLIDYPRQMAQRHRVLEALAHNFFTGDSPRQRLYQNFLRENPKVDDYAQFRATTETLKIPWPEWPTVLREGKLTNGDYEEKKRRYHLYAQWIAHEQVTALAQRARREEMHLYLDLPLGFHPHGYDAWREQALLAPGISVGAPPDTFFTKGQNWGFPPLIPEKSRQQGHAYFRAVLQHQISAAGMLRIDHVMGLHRLFWIPHGFPAHEGCYVRYPEEEFYAVLCLESQRAGCLLVGEDLGTVPPEVRPEMARRRILRTYLAPFDFRNDPNTALGKIPSDSVANLNTHDTPTFAGFWLGQDLEDREALGLLDTAEANTEKQKRRELRRALIDFFQKLGGQESLDSDPDLLAACLAYLGKSKAPWVIVNLEDLWAEELPQNVPGTHLERPNWRRAARYFLEEFRDMPEILKIFGKLRRTRSADSE